MNKKIKKHLENLKKVENVMLPDERENFYSIIKELEECEEAFGKVEVDFDAICKNYEENVKTAEEIYKTEMNEVYNKKTKINKKIEEKENEINNLYKELYNKIKQQKETGTVNKENMKCEAEIIEEDDDYIFIAIPKKLLYGFNK